MSVIAELIRAGVDPELVARVVDELVEVAREARSIVDTHSRSAAAIRQDRYRRNKASQNVTRDVTPPPPKEEISPIPPKEEITPSPQPSFTGLRPVPSGCARARTQIPEDARPMPQDQIFYMDHGRGQFDEDWAQFRDHHRSRGNTMLDWRAAWRTWVRNSAKFTARTGPHGHGRSNGTEGFVKSVLEDIENDKRRRGEKSDPEAVPMLRFDG